MKVCVGWDGMRSIMLHFFGTRWRNTTYGLPNTVVALPRKEMFWYPLGRNLGLPMNVMDREKISAFARH
jgi:hypothetical protein